LTCRRDPATGDLDFDHRDLDIEAGAKGVGDPEDVEDARQTRVETTRDRDDRDAHVAYDNR